MYIISYVYILQYYIWYYWCQIWIVSYSRSSHECKNNVFSSENRRHVSFTGNVRWWLIDVCSQDGEVVLFLYSQKLTGLKRGCTSGSQERPCVARKRRKARIFTENDHYSDSKRSNLEVPRRIRYSSCKGCGYHVAADSCSLLSFQNRRKLRTRHSAPYWLQVTPLQLRLTCDVTIWREGTSRSEIWHLPNRISLHCNEIRLASGSMIWHENSSGFSTSVIEGHYTQCSQDKQMTVRSGIKALEDTARSQPKVTILQLKLVCDTLIWHESIKSYCGNSGSVMKFITTQICPPECNVSTQPLNPMIWVYCRESTPGQ